MAGQRNAQIGFKVRHQPESARHGQRQRAVREDDLFLPGENPRRIAHEDRLIRQLADQRHRDQRRHIAFAAAINALGVENCQGKTAGALDRT